MRNFRSLSTVCALLLFVAGSVFSQKVSTEDLIAKHLLAIGTESIRAGARSMMVVGTGSQKFTSTSDAPAEGRLVIASEAVKMYLGMSMNSPQYPGQQFKFDGKKHDVAITTQNGRDFLGNFVQDNGALLKAGIFGGTFSTGWLMSNYATEKGKLSMSGTSKVNGRDAYAVEFLPKGGSDLAIKLFFDTETYQHVRTEYRRITSAPQGVMAPNNFGRMTGDNSARQSETRFTVTEDFGDFRSERGLMMPHSYKITYSRFGNQGTVECQWAFTMTDFIVNPKLAPESFLIDAKETAE